MKEYGVPWHVVSDNGVQFLSAVLQEVAYCLNFRQNLNPSYQPATKPVCTKNYDLNGQLSILSKHDQTTCGAITGYSFRNKHYKVDRFERRDNHDQDQFRMKIYMNKNPSETQNIPICHQTIRRCR